MSTRGQADARRGQSVGSTVSSECRRSTGLPGGETRSSVRSSDSARISSACAEGSSLPPFRSSGRRGSARRFTRFASGSSRIATALPDCGRCDPTPKGRETPTPFSARRWLGHSSRVDPPLGRNVLGLSPPNACVSRGSGACGSSRTAANRRSRDQGRTNPDVRRRVVNV